MMFRTILVMLTWSTVFGGSTEKRHGHNGTLLAYDGKPIPFKVTEAESLKLDKGEPVLTIYRTLSTD